MASIWGTVTEVSPLRIRLDGDTAALSMTPDSLLDPLGVAVSDRVRVELSGNRVVVLGRSGGQGDTGRVPHAVAAGLTRVSGTGTGMAEVTVTLPSGRFSVPPIVVASVSYSTASAYFIASADSVTTSSFTIRLVRPGATFAGSYDVPWTATQMSSGSASG